MYLIKYSIFYSNEKNKHKREFKDNKQLSSLVNTKCMNAIPFQTIDWKAIEKVEYQGETGVAYWQTLQLDGLRIRLVEYTKGYLADHWCQKEHIVYCLEGAFTTELSTGEQFNLNKGGTYVVSDELSSHRSITQNGVKLLIIDGDFLK